jgi:hypothetical protein
VTPLHPATGEALTAEDFAAAYEPALREGNLGMRLRCFFMGKGQAR